MDENKEMIANEELETEILEEEVSEEAHCCDCDDECECVECTCDEAQPREVVGYLYRLYTAYDAVPLTILMNHVDGQKVWIPDLVNLLKLNNVPTDITDTTMYSDAENYDEQKYAMWAARMINKSDIIVLNVNEADGEASIESLRENLTCGLFNDKYVIVRVDPNMSVENIQKIAAIIDPLENVLHTFDDKSVVQSIYAVAKSFN